MDEQQNSARELRREGENDDAFHQAQDVFPRLLREQVLHRHALPKGYLAANPPEEDHGYGHNADAADLDQAENDTLPDGREVGACIHNDQAGDAYGRSRRKHGIDPAD
jgi:hypothetical protein